MCLIKFEGKPIEKLIEVLSQGIGTLYKPRAIRKEADAEAYKIGVIERAKNNAIAEGKIIDLDLYENIQNRIVHQETRKQLNIDNIVDIAAGQLNLEQSVSDEKVDQDWTTRFFNIAEYISNEEMQKLWGRILAGEIKQPNSFSLRTLELLKNLTKEEAEIFSKFAQLKVKSISGDFIPYKDKPLLEKKFNIKYTEILLLNQLGLITSSSTLGLSFKGDEKLTSTLFENGETGILVKTQPNNTEHNVHVMVFTKSGSELSNLISYEKNHDYIQYICKSLTTPYTSITVGTTTVEDGEVYLIETYDYKN